MTLAEIEAWVEDRSCHLHGYALADAMKVLTENWRAALADNPNETIERLASIDIPEVIDLLQKLHAEIMG